MRRRAVLTILTVAWGLSCLLSLSASGKSGGLASVADIEHLIARGAALFGGDSVTHAGRGRLTMKGTGRVLAHPLNVLVGVQRINRLSAPDANSCEGCHNAPYRIAGGGGDFVTSVFVLAQRFDAVSFEAADAVPTRAAVDETGRRVTLQTVGNLRATPGLFGAGYLEMLAREMTDELQRSRDAMQLGDTRALVAKGVHFGSLTLTETGIWDTSQVTGLGRPSLLSGGTSHPPSLIIRPWHQAGHVISLRDFTNTAFNHHHGLQSVERFGLDTDRDGDGVTNELTQDDVTAVTLFQATLQVPGRVISRRPDVEAAVLLGERAFERIGCAHCHIPKLPLDRRAWVYIEPNPFNPSGNLLPGDAPEIKVDLSSDALPVPRLRPDASGTVWVEAYTDFKLHDICGSGPLEREPLDMNQSPQSPKFREGNCLFLTKRLWGAANEPPFFHHGQFTTLRRSVLAHDGEARVSRLAFEALGDYERDSVIEFLKTLQVLPPGTKHRIVDGRYQPREWPPRTRRTTVTAIRSGERTR